MEDRDIKNLAYVAFFSSGFWLKLPLEPMDYQGFEVTPSIK
jgi:hypothetical protein